LVGGFPELAGRERRGQRIEQRSGPVFSFGCCLVPVEIGALLGQDERGPRA
jgi:hypothetical protein